MKKIYLDKSKSIGERALALLSYLTDDEKVGQLNQGLYGFSCYKITNNKFELTKDFKDEVKKYGGLGILYGLYRADPWSKKDYSNGIINELVSSAYNSVQHYVINHSRLKIPVLMSSECPHGHQALNGYILPVNLAMGATFNPSLVEKAYKVCCAQMKEMGVNLALISMLDVLRDPRWGRSEECFSEDPFLCSKMAAAAVKGCQSQGVAVVAKHFCAQGEGTGGINASAARIGERELREIHIPPAKSCCNKKVEGIMAAYNEIDGLPCHANPYLLKKILRDELNFKGIVMADGTAIDRLDILTNDNIRSGALALNSGVDVSLWDTGFSKLKEALKRGIISEETLDKAVLRVLELKLSQGLFEHPYLKEKIDLSKYNYNNFNESLDLARESVVLLKNEDEILPINPEKEISIAVIGPNADSIYNQMGDYTPPVIKDTCITLLHGITKEAGGKVTVKYAKGCDIFSSNSEELKYAISLVQKSDIVILALGGSSSRFGGASFDKNGAAVLCDKQQMDCGEGMDCADLSISQPQMELADEVFKTKTPVITVMIQGRPYAIPEISKKSNALICAFYPGPLGGSAIAEIIFGKYPPSGRLPVSIPRSTGQIPVYYNYKSSYNAMNYINEKNTPLYPFGFGLSCTSFKYDEIELSDKAVTLNELSKKGVSVSLKITNTGKREGFSVPMLYIHDRESSTVQRIEELKAFSKVRLKSAESAVITLDLEYDDLAVWNSNMEFVVEKGEFDLYLMDSDKLIWQDRFAVI